MTIDDCGRPRPVNVRDLSSLWKAVVAATASDELFWIGEILLDTIHRETGYHPNGLKREATELGLEELGRSFLEEYERYCREGAFPGFVCCDSPVEIIVHLINERDEARARTERQS